MASYKSKYKGKEIDERLDKVSDVWIEIVENPENHFLAEPGKYYRFDEPVGDLEITVPHIAEESDDGKIVRAFEVFFASGDTPKVNIKSEADDTIDYFTGFSIEAGKTYELNFMWNGNEWVVAYGIVE